MSTKNSENVKIFNKPQKREQFQKCRKTSQNEKPPGNPFVTQK